MNDVSYFINFGFEGIELTDYHCTHMYLGILNYDEVGQIISIIDKFFEVNKPNEFYTEFNAMEVFGNKKVLLGNIKDFILWDELFNLIEGVKKSEHKFNPHVTVRNGETGLSGIIDRYVLIAKVNKKVNELRVRDLD